MMGTTPRLSQLSGFYELCYTLLELLGEHAEAGELELDLPGGAIRAVIRFGPREKATQVVEMEQIRTSGGPVAPDADWRHWDHIDWRMRVYHDMRVAEVARFCGRKPGSGILDPDYLRRQGLLPDDKLQQNRFAAEWLARCLRLLEASEGAARPGSFRLRPGD